MDARIKAVLTEIQEICRANDCNGACPFVGVGSKRCAFGIDPVDWEFNVFTKPERDLLRLTGAKFISRDKQGPYCGSVNLWSVQPEKRADGTFCVSLSTPCMININRLSAELFPSVPPGVCWDVTVLLGEGEVDHGE